MFTVFTVNNNGAQSLYHRSYTLFENVLWVFYTRINVCMFVYRSAKRINFRPFRYAYLRLKEVFSSNLSEPSEIKPCAVLFFYTAPIRFWTKQLPQIATLKLTRTESHRTAQFFCWRRIFFLLSGVYKRMLFSQMMSVCFGNGGRAETKM